MAQLIDSLQRLLVSGWEVVVALLILILPWSPLIAWIAFWLFAVNWEKLYPVLARGAFIGVALIGVMMVMVWGLIAPPPDGVHHILGIQPPNFYGKLIYVALLFSIMMLCGAVQLSGALGKYGQFDDEPDEESAGHHDHQHDHHGGHEVLAHSGHSGDHSHHGH